MADLLATWDTTLQTAARDLSGASVSLSAVRLKHEGKPQVRHGTSLPSGDPLLIDIIAGGRFRRSEYINPKSSTKQAWLIGGRGQAIALMPSGILSRVHPLGVGRIGRPGPSDRMGWCQCPGPVVPAVCSGDRFHGPHLQPLPTDYGVDPPLTCIGRPMLDWLTDPRNHSVS